MPRLGADLAQRLQPGDLLLLNGPMGAGKTTWYGTLVAALGGDPEHVTSPSYTLQHQYAASTPVIHVDAWRLSSGDELVDLGFEELRGDAIARLGGRTGRRHY